MVTKYENDREAHLNLKVEKCLRWEQVRVTVGAKKKGRTWSRSSHQVFEEPFSPVVMECVQ